MLALAWMAFDNFVCVACGCTKKLETMKDPSSFSALNIFETFRIALLVIFSTNHKFANAS